MKTISQLLQEIKAAGLTGRAAELELRDRLFNQVEETILFIVNSPNTSNVRPEYLADDLTRILEIFAYSAGDFDRKDFAVDLQEFLFKQSFRYGVSYKEWRKDIFGADESEWSAILTDDKREGHGR